MAQKLSFYCENQPIYDLMERFGDRLEDMAFDSLLAFQAVLATYTFYSFSDGKDEDPNYLFNAAASQVWNSWKKRDPEAYSLVKAFCTEVIDGEYVAASCLVSIQEGLANCIQCHWGSDEN